MAEVKGDLRVRRTLQADRRADEGLNSETLAGNRAVVRDDYAILNLNPNGANRDVTLPDATTLPLGWKIRIRNSGGANNLVVKDNGGSTLKTISSPAATFDTLMYEFVLLTNGTAAGTYSVLELGDAGAVAATRYSASFVSGDWSAPSGGYITLTVLAATHGRGTNPSVKILEDISGDFDEVICDRMRINASGDIEFRIVEGLEFGGKYIIV